MLRYFQAEKQEPLLFLAVGAVALERTLEAGPPAYRSAETAGMAGVTSSFRDYEVIEVVLVTQAAFMLVLDLLAAQRGRAYLDALARLA
jgi:hypothetical protein